MKVKFTSFTTKQSVFTPHQSFQSLGVSVSGDYLLATRQAIKKFIEYGKSRDTVFKLGHSELRLDGKCFMYNPERDLLFENRAEQAIPVVTPLSPPLFNGPWHSSGGSGCRSKHENA